MSDPGGDSLGHWALDVLTGLLVSIVGSTAIVVGWWGKSKKAFSDDIAAYKTAINERVAGLEKIIDKELDRSMEEDREVFHQNGARDNRITRLESQHENIKEKLEEIKQDIERTALQGAHSVNTQLATVLTEVQKLVAKEQRRS